MRASTSQQKRKASNKHSFPELSDDEVKPGKESTIKGTGPDDQEFRLTQRKKSAAEMNSQLFDYVHTGGGKHDNDDALIMGGG